MDPETQASILTAEMLQQWAASRILDYAVLVYLNGILFGLGIIALLQLVGWRKLSLSLGLIVGLAIMLVPGTVALVSGAMFGVANLVALLRDFRLTAPPEPELDGVAGGKD